MQIEFWKTYPTRLPTHDCPNCEYCLGLNLTTTNFALSLKCGAAQGQAAFFYRTIQQVFVVLGMLDAEATVINMVCILHMRNLSLFP